MSAQPIPAVYPADFMHFTDVSQLPPHRLAEIRRFFADYKAAVSCCLMKVSFMLTLTVLEQVMTCICFCLPSMRCTRDPQKGPQSASCLLSLSLSSDLIDQPGNSCTLSAKGTQYCVAAGRSDLPAACYMHSQISHSSGAFKSAAACCLQEKKEVKVGIEFLNAEEARQAIVESMRRYAGQLCCHLIPQVYNC